MQDTRPILLANTDFPAITRNVLSTLQVNLGYLCNMSCVHCHVNAGPTRTEEMDSETADLVIEVMKRRSIGCLDLTGGAPEMNAHFRRIVQAARSMDVEVIDRCNLTILLQPGYEGLADFLAEQAVTVTASLPCYTEDNVEKQRGKGAYEESIEALQMLNRLGYGSDAKLKLNLAYNPIGPHLPPSQQALELDYKRELKQQHDIIFNSLFTITNVPIARFGAVLLAHNQYDDYLSLLKDNYASENLESVMCRDLISVDWQGNLYDCDFNQMLDIPMRDNSATENQIKLVEKKHLRDLLQTDYASNAIRVADHCYACTAGQGSSCSGAL